MRVPDETPAPNGNMVFVAVLCLDDQPYLGYDQPITGAYDQVIPRVLLADRWDGRVGFYGGWQEGDEPLRVVAVREADEEAGLLIAEEDLEPVCSHHDREGRGFHLYALVAHSVWFRDIIAGLKDAKHFHSEVTGFKAANIEWRDETSGVAAVLSNPFSGNARVQLACLIQRYNLVPDFQKVIEILPLEDMAELLPGGDLPRVSAG